MDSGYCGRHRSARKHRRTVPIIYGGLGVVGASLLGWALLNQQATPPSPQAGSGSEILVQAWPSGDSAPSWRGPTQPADASVAMPTTDRKGKDEPSVAGDRTSSSESGTQALPPSPPESVHIPSIELSSPLHHLGLNGDGTLAVPSGERYDEPAWYDGSPTPGEIGPSVIEGHVTSRGSTPSVFFDLGALQVGDTVEVAREDGTVVHFVIYATDSFPKDDFPTTAVYGNTDVAELRLITCGGNYDSQAHAHVSNVVVFARMTESRS